MIYALLTLTIMAFGPQGEFPEKPMGKFKTEEACWAAIDHFMADLPKVDRTALSLHWRCGDTT